MRITLQFLELQNFKGIEYFRILPKGKDIIVYGDNAAGKTTLFDAFSWLLFGKDSKHRADFEVRPIGREAGDTVVTAMLATEDSEIVLQKTLREKWVRKRGEATRTFGGTVTEYHINGELVGKAKFDQTINELCDEDLFMLLTNPLHFSEHIHWTERRKILLSLVELDDVKLAESREEWKVLLPLLQSGGDLETARKELVSQQNRLVRELDKIPARVEELRRAQVEPVDESAIQALRKKLESKRAQQEAATAEIEAATDYTQIQKRTKLRHELVQLRNTIARLQTMKRGVCPTCKQPLPADPKQDAVRERELAQLRKMEARYRKQLAECRGETPATPDAAIAAQKELGEEIEQLQRELMQLEFQLEQWNRHRSRLEELQQQEKTLMRQHEEIGQKIAAIEQFVQYKTGLLEERVNELFQLARFKLFDTLNNGSVVETCVVTVDGVPYSDLNHGMRLNAGLDIINALSQYYQLSVPIFIDNAESVTKLLPTVGQQIRLVVKAGSELTVHENTASSVGE